MRKSISVVAVALFAAGVYAKEAERIRNALAVTGTAEVVAIQSFGGSNVVSAVRQAGYDARADASKLLVFGRGDDTFL